MKKVVAVILAMIMILSFSAVGYAEEETKTHAMVTNYLKVNGAINEEAFSALIGVLQKDFAKLGAENISLFGWVAESHEHEAFGYSIDDGEPVFSDDFWVNMGAEDDTVVDALYDWDNYRSRFDIVVPVNSEVKSVSFLMRYKDGEIIKLFQVNNVPEKETVLYDKAVATGGGIIFEVNYWLTNETNSLHTGESAAVAFRSVGNLYKIGFKQFWASNPVNDNQVRATLQFDLYKFTGDFDESVEAEPIASVSAEAKGDDALTNLENVGTNCTMERAGNGGALLVLNEPAAPGRYLFVVTEVTRTEEDSIHYLVLPEQNNKEYDYNKFVFYKDGFEDELFSFDAYVYSDVKDPFGPIAASATYHNASFDTFKINGEMAAIQETDGKASEWLDKVSRKVDGSDGSVQTVGFRGWIGFEETIDAFGYQIGSSAPVFDPSFIEEFADENQKNAVQAEENGGSNALRFNITVPVDSLEGENTIVAVAKVEGKTIRIDSTLAASGDATKPDTEIIYTGKAAATSVPEEPTEAPSEAPAEAPTSKPDAPAKKENKSNITPIIILAACLVVIAAAVVFAVIKKKKK